MKTSFAAILFVALLTRTCIAGMPINILQISVLPKSDPAHAFYSIAVDRSVWSKNAASVVSQVSVKQYKRIRHLMSELPDSQPGVEPEDCITIQMIILGAYGADIEQKEITYDRRKLPHVLEEIIELLGGLQPKVRTELKFKTSNKRVHTRTHRANAVSSA